MSAKVDATATMPIRSITPPYILQSKKYSWAEVEKHASAEDAWTVVNGQVYDITSFVKKHPGGHIILTAAGKDGTPLLQIHHPFTSAPEKVLAPLQIGVIEGSDYYAKSEFFTELVSRMKKAGFGSRAAIRNDKVMMMKGFALVFLWALTYYLGWVHGYTLAVLCHGLVMASIGMQVMHDGNHQGTNVSWFNWLAGETITLMGGCSQQWTFGHLFHHQAPNQEFDPDTIQAPGILRYRDDEPVFWFMNYQHIYAWFLYCSVFLKKRAQAFTHMFHPTKFEGMTLPPPSVQYHVYFCLMFVMNCYRQFYLPIKWWGLGWFLPAFFLQELVGGFLLGLVFQVNHITIDCELAPGQRRDPKIDWAADQILGSNNFTQGHHRSFMGWVIGHLTGGLGYQIEHHLFPVSSHVMLPHICDFVSTLAKERGINYVMHTSLWKALKSHQALLVKRGPVAWANRNKKAA